MSGEIQSRRSLTPGQLQKRFRQVVQERTKSRELVDTIERMGEAMLTLDGTPFDLDPAEDAVAVEQKGLIGLVEGDKELGLVFSLNVLDERGPEPKEFSKEMTLLESDSWGDTYKVVSASQTEVVVQSEEGLLTYHSTAHT